MSTFAVASEYDMLHASRQIPAFVWMRESTVLWILSMKKPFVFSLYVQE